MAALEYLTENSLTNYPFRSFAGPLASESHVIGDDWFYDILFVSYDRALNGVYIDRIEKNVAQDSLTIYFSNAATNVRLSTPATFSLTEDLHIHYGPGAVKPFAAFSCSQYAVKFLFGPGLVNSESFTEDFSSKVSTLANSAFILHRPMVDNLVFEGYYDGEVLEVAKFFTGDTAHVHPRYNAEFKSEGKNIGGLYVGRNLGAGLYDGCPEGPITDVYSLNNVVPDSSGAMIFKASSCYSLNTLSANDKLLFNSNITGSISAVVVIAGSTPIYLVIHDTLKADKIYFFNQKYELSWEDISGRWQLIDKLDQSTIALADIEDVEYPWLAHWPTDMDVFDVVTPNHSLFLQNYCRPKCPPETINAFGHYINRVSDAVSDLYKLALNNYETRGFGSWEKGSRIFVATSFCLADNPFERCTTYNNPIVDIPCADPNGTPYRFTKYFDEGKKLYVWCSEIRTESFVIKEVAADGASVVLDRALPDLGSGEIFAAFFRVANSGVVQDINCAIAGYNDQSAINLKPLFKVKYTTSEAYNKAGLYSTYLAVTVAIFNPSTSTVTVEVHIDNNEYLTKQGNFKIRTSNSLSISDEVFPRVSLECKEYVFVEGVYNIVCDTFGGAISVDVYDVNKLPLEGGYPDEAKIGATVPVAGIDGVGCSDSPAEVPNFSIQLLYGQEDFEYYVDVDPAVTAIDSVLNLVPSWLKYELEVATHRVRFYTDHAITESASQKYLFRVNLVNAAEQLYVFNVSLVYIALPIIAQPTAQIYGQDSPLDIDKSINYTMSNPAVSVTAYNLVPLDNNYNPPYAWFSSSAVPTGFTFSATTGQLTGQLPSDYPYTASFPLTITASNFAGSASETIYLRLGVSDVPVITFSASTPGPTFEVDAAVTYSANTGLFSLDVTSSFPVVQYMLTGSLASGLVFDASTGKIYGRAIVQEDFSRSYSIVAKTQSATSSPLIFTLNYAKRFIPELTYPTNGIIFPLRYNDNFTDNSPLFVAASKQALGGTDNFDPALTDVTRNKYSIAGGPPGFSIGQYTGKFYGRLDSGEIPSDLREIKEYSLILYVDNPLGTDSVGIKLRFSNAILPTIFYPAEGEIRTAYRERTYTAQAPLLRVSVSSDTDTLVLSGNLPSGLEISNDKIIGLLANDAVAGEYPIVATATNSAGGVIRNFVIALDAIETRLPNILSPIDEGSRFAAREQNYSSATPLLSVVTQSSNDAVSITGALPEGLSFSERKITGMIAANAPAGVYPITISAVNSLGSTSIDYTLLVGIKVATPLDGESYAALQGEAYSPLFTITTTGVPQGEILSYTTTDLPPGLSLQGDSVVGTPTDESSTTSCGISVSSPTFGQSPSVNAIIRVRPKLFSISGTVLTHLGAPVVGATVYYSGSLTVTTAVNGTYVIPDLAGGITYTITVAFGNKLVNPVRANVSVGSSDVINVNFVVDLSKVAISGRVLYANSSPVQGIRIYVGQATVFTNSKGYYLTHVVPNAALSIAPENLVGYSFSPATRTVNATDDVVDADFTAISLRQLAGSVILPAGTVLADGVKLYLDYPGQPEYMIRSASDGSFSFDVTAGTHIVSINPENEILTATDAAYTGYYSFTPESIERVVADSGFSDLVFTGVKQPDVRGKITATALIGDPAVSVEIPVKDVDIFVDGVQADTTNASGNYVLAGLSVGQYTIAPIRAGMVFSPATRTVEVVGSGADIVDQNFESTANYDISGNVTHNPSSAGIYLAEIALRDADDTLLASAQTDEDGYFIFAGLPKGAYTLVPSRTAFIFNPASSSIVISSANAAQDFTASTSNSLLPLAPQITSWVSVNEGIRINFSIPNSTAPIAYTLGYEYNLDGAADWLTPSVPVAFGDTTLVISNLTPFTTYSVKIRAKNFVGAGSASNSVSVVTSASNPDPPVIDSVSPGNMRVYVNFTAPIFTGGAVITNYRYSLNGGSTWIDRAPAATTSPITITGLSNGTQYTIAVAAVNAAGKRSIASNNVNVTPAPEVPEAPYIRTLTGLDSSILVDFDAPSSNGGSPIVNYQYSLDSGDTWQDRSPVGVTGLFTIGGLLRLHNYSVVIRAVNAIGAGSISNQLSATTLAGVPTAPTIDSVDVPRGKLTVNFSPPADNCGSTISNYEYSALTYPDYSYWHTRSPASLASPLVILGAQNGLTYYVKIRAVSDMGPSDISNVFQVTVPNDFVADTPTLSIQEQVGIDYVVLQYEYSPDQYSYEFYNYYTDVTGIVVLVDNVRISMDSVEWDFLAKVVRVNGLTAGVTYDFAIIAVNSTGESEASNTVQGTPMQPPPVLDVFTVTRYGIVVELYAKLVDGAGPVTEFKYSIDDKVTWLDPEVNTSDTRFATFEHAITGVPLDIFVKLKTATGEVVSATAEHLDGMPSIFEFANAPGVTWNYNSGTNPKIVVTLPDNASRCNIVAYRYNFGYVTEKIYDQNFPYRSYNTPRYDMNRSKSALVQSGGYLLESFSEGNQPANVEEYTITEALTETDFFRGKLFVYAVTSFGGSNYDGYYSVGVTPLNPLRPEVPVIVSCESAPRNYTVFTLDSYADASSVTSLHTIGTNEVQQNPDFFAMTLRKNQSDWYVPSWGNDGLPGAYFFSSNPRRVMTYWNVAAGTFQRYVLRFKTLISGITAVSPPSLPCNTTKLTFPPKTLTLLEVLPGNNKVVVLWKYTPEEGRMQPNGFQYALNGINAWNSTSMHPTSFSDPSELYLQSYYGTRSVYDAKAAEVGAVERSATVVNPAISNDIPATLQFRLTNNEGNGNASTSYTLTPKHILPQIPTVTDIDFYVANNKNIVDVSFNIDSSRVTYVDGEKYAAQRVSAVQCSIMVWPDGQAAPEPSENDWVTGVNYRDGGGYYKNGQYFYHYNSDKDEYNYGDMKLTISSGIASGVTYAIRVRALGEDNEFSIASPAEKLTTTIEPPPRPYLVNVAPTVNNTLQYSFVVAPRTSWSQAKPSTNKLRCSCSNSTGVPGGTSQNVTCTVNFVPQTYDCFYGGYAVDATCFTITTGSQYYYVHSIASVDAHNDNNISAFSNIITHDQLGNDLHRPVITSVKGKDGYIEVDWSYNEGGTGHLTGSEIAYSYSLGEAGWTAFSAMTSDRPLQIPATNGQNYILQFKASYNNVESSVSDLSITTPGAAPAMPIIGNIVCTVSNNQATINYTQTDENEKQRLSHVLYELTLWPVGATPGIGSPESVSAWLPNIVPGACWNRVPIVITDLLPARNYSIRLKSCGSGGDFSDPTDPTVFQSAGSP